MPEGHTLHRAAIEQGDLLRARRVSATSPQGRFAEGAAAIHGAVVTDVEAYGKHLLYRFDMPRVLHVHLGLYGAYRIFNPPESAPPPTSGTRLELSTDTHVIRLAGPTACDLVDEPDAEALVSRLGPDPLRADYDAERVWQNLRRRTTPIAAALMDQSVIAGVGNVFRAEALFVCRINPHLPSNRLKRPAFDQLEATLRGMLHDGVRRGSIVTIPDDELGDETRYVYRRTGLPCFICSTGIVAFEMANRMVYACPKCQRVRRPPRR